MTMASSAPRQLRRASGDDRAFCEALARDNMAAYREARGIAWDPLRFAASWSAFENWIVVAAGEAVGTLRLLAEDDALAIRDLQVRPGAQRQGHGTWAIGEARRLARQRGATGLRLRVYPDNPALRLYQRLGFAVAGERDGVLHLQAALHHHRACLSLGSNLDAERHLLAAVRALAARFELRALSSLYRCPAVGFEGPEFLNAAAVIACDLDAGALDAWLHALEDAHGRDRRAPRYASRTLDVDIVLFDDAVLAGPGHFVIPRPELAQAFVLKPLAAIAPAWIEPVSGLTLAALWAQSPQHGAPCAAVRVPGWPQGSPGAGAE
jgi:2-amino-4-hydroxy-6-hydroxymethyldihydropteridine diphosphokinase